MTKYPEECTVHSVLESNESTYSIANKVQLQFSNCIFCKNTFRVVKFDYAYSTVIHNLRYNQKITAMKNLLGGVIWSLILIFSSCEIKEVTPEVFEDAIFTQFSTNGQTLTTFISSTANQVKLEVARDIDITRLVPSFDIPEGYSAFVNGNEQFSGTSQVDFSQTVTYDLVNNHNNITSWQVSVLPLSCKILVDASHDGGVWWFPQGEDTGFDPDEPHQGQSFANVLRDKGFEVTELGRGVELTEEMFFGHYIVLRAGGLQHYTDNELEVYTKLIERGMNMVFFTDHKNNDPVDELGDLLGLDFKGVAFGTITTFGQHEITANIESIDYIAGSIIANADENPNIEVLGWLSEDDFADLNFNGVKDVDEPVAPPVMGILSYPKSRVFFIGDMNGLQIQPQPFIDNLINWMGDCNW